MSSDDKRSGISDIRTLRERLGKMKQNKATSESQTPESTQTDVSTSDDSKTAQNVPITGAVEHGSADLTPAAGSPIEASLNTTGYAGGNDMPEQKTSSPSAQSSPFAHPLQTGRYKQAEASTSLSAADQAEIEEYDKKHSNRMKMMSIVGVAGLFVGLLFGYLSGGATDARARFNLSVEVASDTLEELTRTNTTIDQIADAFGAESSRLDEARKALSQATTTYRSTKANKKLRDDDRKKKLDEALADVRKFKSELDKGVRFDVILTKLPSEMKIATSSLVKEAQYLPAAIRAVLVKHLLEVDRVVRLANQFQQTASAVNLLNQYAAKRFGPVLAIDTQNRGRHPAFASVPKVLSKGQVHRFTKERAASFAGKSKGSKVGRDIEIVGLTDSDEKAKSVKTSKVVVIPTASAVEITAQVYPVIQGLLVIQYGELTELLKTTKDSGVQLMDMLKKHAGEDKKLAL